MNKVSTEDVLNKAYRLAYFLHQDKGTAMRIVAAATLKLNVAMAAQSKRLYYVPVGRFSRGELRRSDAFRNKALFSDLHLLQRLLYGESEPYERQKELAVQARPPGAHADGDTASEEDLLVYFVKHLVRITTKRNAFYVTLGVSRLLHSYSTLETMEIYNAVIGEPERVKDDYYYRSRKGVLMHEMYQRFGQLIRACRQRRGEERFETQPGSSEQRSLVRECLRLFTPWDTQCPVPSDFDPFRMVIARLTSKVGEDENRIEVNRIHAVLHPNCFERLVAAFGYGAPVERIEVPRFFSDNSDDQSPPQQRRAPTDLSADELAEINHMLDEQAGRRRRSAPAAVIRIMVDGVERARLNPAEESSISFSAEDNAEMIEVTTADQGGDLLLATHLLSSREAEAHNKPIVSSIRLEGGQKLSLSITRRPVDASGPADMLVKFGYRETNPLRAARLWRQRLLRRRSRKEREPNSFSLLGGPRTSARYVLAGGVVAVCLASYIGYVTLRTPVTSGPTQSSNVQATTPATETPTGANNSSKPSDQVAANVTEPKRTPSQQPRRVRTGRATRTNTPAAASPGTNAPTSGEEAADVMRSGTVAGNLTLKDVKKVYVEIRSTAALGDLRNSFVDSLSSSGVIGATTDANEADAALKLVVSHANHGRIEATARLVNARGNVLWQKRGGGYSGEPAKVVSEIVRDLLTAIRNAK